MSETKYLNLGLYTNKQEGDLITDTIWNGVFNSIETAVNGIYNNGTNGGGGGDSHISFDSTGKHNLNIVTTASDLYLKNGETKGGKINIEPISDLLIKAGDDVILYSHHREDPTEVSVKVTDGEDHPVKLQVNAADIVLTAKDKNLTKEKNSSGVDTNTTLYSDPDVLNITVNKAKNTRGYLKVRAQAIDLRCENHGGIALLPKGNDGSGYENKIKFEHGGGDGLEFGTFNTLHTSLFTNDYRFNKNGIIRLAERFTEPSDKADNSDTTTSYKYIKNNSANNAAKSSSEGKTFNIADDFYDFVDSSSPTCTWEDLVEYISWAKANWQGPFTLNRHLNKQILNLRLNDGRIHIVIPTEKAPASALDFIDNIVSIKAKLNSSSNEIYTLTAQLGSNDRIGFVGMTTTSQGIAVARATLLTFNILAGTPGETPAVIDLQDDLWYITEIEYNDSSNNS